MPPITRSTARAAELQATRLRKNAEKEQAEVELAFNRAAPAYATPAVRTMWQERMRRGQVYNADIGDGRAMITPRREGDGFDDPDFRFRSGRNSNDNRFANGGMVNEMLLLFERQTSILFQYPSELAFPAVPPFNTWCAYKPAMLLAPSILYEAGVYVKRVRWRDVANNHDLARESFLNEVYINDMLARVPHPHIGRYLGARVHQGRITGIVLERFPTSLRDITQDEFAAINKSDFFDGLVAAIAHLHKLGLAHNDLKPANIMVRDGLPYLIDFGSTNVSGARLTGTLVTRGWSRPALLEGNAQGYPIFSDRENDELALVQMFDGWTHEQITK